jgi:hypothetical protein
MNIKSLTPIIRAVLLEYHKYLDGFNDPTIYNASESMIDDFLDNLKQNKDDELAHFLNNLPNGGLWGISEKREQFRTQCSMIDLMEWVLDIKTYKPNER